jgi:tRNA A37 threonylcarbamoyladenosine modification protein TsaB
LGVYQTASISGEDTGKIVLFIVNAVLNKLGKKLDKGYRCPVYCDIDHKHIYWENYETEKSNISTDDELSRPDEYELREQQESSLRPIASTN